MRNGKAVFMIATALVLASAAVLLAWRMVDGRTRADTEHVVVAAQNIDLGTRLTPDMLKVVDYTKGSVPEGAFQSIAPLLKDAETGEPRVTRVSLQRSEPLLPSRLAPVGSAAGLSAVITPGKRAITVRVNDVVGVAGFALPGSYVDVLVNTTATSGGQQSDKSISKTVLEHILVLAGNQEAGRDKTEPKVVNAVTLEVTPEQAETIDLARSVGTLSLVLRNQVDTETPASIGVTKQQLLGRAADEVQPALIAQREIPRVRHALPTLPQGGVELIRGTERTNKTFTENQP